MNMNRIINMIINQFIRRGINMAMKFGMNSFAKSRKGAKESDDVQDSQQINVSKEDQQKLRSVRRNRF